MPGTSTTQKKLKSSKIGLKNVHVAEFDPVTQKWTTPEPVETIRSMEVTVNITSGEEYADDMLFESFDSFNNFDVDLEFTDLTPSEQAFFLGWTSVGAMHLQGADDNPPYVALLGERTKADGTVRMFKYFKGKARPVNESSGTKGSSVSVQPDKLKIIFGPLPADFPVPAFAKKARGILDTSDPAYDSEAETWYEEVIPGCTVT